VNLDVLLSGIGVLGVLVAALSARIRTMPISEPLLGLAAGMVLGPAILGALTLAPLPQEHTLLHEASRVLLAVSVMGVALRYPLDDVRRRTRPVLLLLLVVMPGMALVTSSLGWLVLGLPVGAALLLGTALAPTDPVLASSVVTGEPAERDLPARDREILSLESGANDGLALPLVVAALAVAGPMSGADAVLESVWQVLGAVVLGVGAGWLGGRALRSGEEHGAADSGPVLFFTIVLALAVLGIAGVMRVDGILAVFVGGLAFNAVSSGRERRTEVPIDEAVNRFAVLPVFVLVGATVPWADWADLGWRGPVLAAGVLLLRRLPFLLLLRRPIGLGRPDAAYLGWFGPVGVSALFYLTLEADRIGVHADVLAAGSMVLVASTVAHGVTASPGRVLYRRVVGSTSEEV
jgi:NhaP-type Na+/H+ or K+/H+ antiporter